MKGCPRYHLVELTREEVVEEVGHCLWTFTVPKLLRPYFLHRRELLGKLCHAAWETVDELIVAATAGKGVLVGSSEPGSVTRTDAEGAATPPSTA